MEAKIFTKVNDGSYKEYFKGSQKEVYALSAQLRARATSKGFRRHYDGCGNIGTSIKYNKKESVEISDEARLAVHQKEWLHPLRSTEGCLG